MELIYTKNGGREEIYTNMNEARIRATMYSCEALIYSRHFNVSKQEEQDIYAFAAFVRKLEKEEFSRMFFSCKSTNDFTAYRITIAVLIGSAWQEVSYICKKLPRPTI